MKTMKKEIGLLVLFVICLCMGCYDDKGNYDYHDFNEITIGKQGFDTAYILTSFVDTLRISPDLDFKLGESKNLTFEWVAMSNGIDFTEYPIGNERDFTDGNIHVIFQSKRYVELDGIFECYSHAGSGHADQWLGYSRGEQ